MRDNRYIHIRWGKITCCDNKMGVQIDKETKEESHYFYDCETRLTPSQVAYHKALDYIHRLEGYILRTNSDAYGREIIEGLKDDTFPLNHSKHLEEK